MPPFCVHLGIQVTLIEPGAIKTGFDEVALGELARMVRTEAYRAMAAAFRRLVEGPYASAPGPGVVVAAVVSAATARRAPVRVVLPASARAMLLVKQLLGERLFDRLIRTQLRPIYPSSQQPAGKQAVRREQQ